MKVESDFRRLPSKPQILTTKVNLGVDQENIMVKVEGDSQKWPSRIQFPSIKVEQHASQVNPRVKGKVDQ